MQTLARSNFCGTPCKDPIGTYFFRWKKATQASMRQAIGPRPDDMLSNGQRPGLPGFEHALMKVAPERESSS